MPPPVPLSAPTAAPLSKWGVAWNQDEQTVPGPPLGPLLVPPRHVDSREDHIGIALPELKIQRFGRKFDHPFVFKDMPAEHAQVQNATTGASSMNSFFQMDSEPKVEAVRQVGEVVADTPTAGQGNNSTPDVPDQAIGFVAAAKPPPSLSEVPPLPFVPDEIPAAIHVSADVATQEVSASNKGLPFKDVFKEVKVPAPAAPVVADGRAKAANASMAQDEAWNNFTAAEALVANGVGHSRDAEALGIDAVAEALPTATSAPGASPPREISRGTFGGITHTDTRQPMHLPMSTHSGGNEAAGVSFVFWLFGIACVVIVGGFCVACLGVGFAASFAWQKRFGAPSIRSRVEDLPLCSASEVERRLPASGGYDCHFSKPLSSGTLMRLEAYIDGPSVGSASLTTPLTGQACVLYSVSVSRQLHDGIRPAPVAFASGSIDFVISLKDAPHVRINLRAEELSLFDMRCGRRVERKAFASAPDKWQDFILKHRAGTEWQTGSQLRADGSCLEFQECALLCGALATFVGELHRGADGTLSLRPLQIESLDHDFSGTPPNSARARSAACHSAALSGRTSWECDYEVDNVIDKSPRAPSVENDGSAHFDKVMVSDDPLLLDGASSLLRRLPGKCGSRALILMNKYRLTKPEKLPDRMERHML